MKDKIHKNKQMKCYIIRNLHLSCHGDKCVFYSESVVEGKFKDSFQEL